MFQGGVSGSCCLGGGVCVIRSVSKGVYIYLVFQGGSWCLGGGVCDTKCKHGCIYLFGVSGWSQWNLVFGGV